MIIIIIIIIIIIKWVLFSIDYGILSLFLCSFCLFSSEALGAILKDQENSTLGQCA